MPCDVVGLERLSGPRDRRNRHQLGPRVAGVRGGVDLHDVRARIRDRDTRDEARPLERARRDHRDNRDHDRETSPEQQRTHRQSLRLRRPDRGDARHVVHVQQLLRTRGRAARRSRPRRSALRERERRRAAAPDDAGTRLLSAIGDATTSSTTNTASVANTARRRENSTAPRLDNAVRALRRPKTTRLGLHRGEHFRLLTAIAAEATRDSTTWPR
jgi:hypothetical protein